MSRYIVIAIIFNIALVIFAGIIFISPVIGSLKSGLASVRLQESRYSAERRLLVEYEDNLRELEEIRAGRRVLEKSEIIPLLAEISMLGTVFGLNSLDFTASEIAENVIGADEISRLYEMRVRMEYEGNFYDLISFLREFMGGYGNTRSFYFSDIMSETSKLRMEFSLFGSD